MAGTAASRSFSAVPRDSVRSSSSSSTSNCSSALKLALRYSLVFAATFYWFPQITSATGAAPRLMSETLGKWHFWLTLTAAYATFLPMHLAGLAGAPRHYSQLNGIQNAATLLLAQTATTQRFISISAFILASAQLLFLANLFHSFRKGRLSAENPWSATTLEWAPSNRPPHLKDHALAVHRAPCDYPINASVANFYPQWAEIEKPE